MSVKHQQLPGDGGFILSEGPGTYAREAVTISNGVTRPGMVLSLWTGGANEGGYGPLNVGGSEGSNVAAAISYGGYDASEDPVPGAVLVRGPAEIMVDRLVWPTGIEPAQIVTALGQLATLGFVFRSDSPTTQLGPSTNP